MIGVWMSICVCVYVCVVWKTLSIPLVLVERPSIFFFFSHGALHNISSSGTNKTPIRSTGGVVLNYAIIGVFV
jgi:hypothetical protein